MKLPTSDKTSSFGNKPHIKKGYYPAKLLKVDLFKDKDGKPLVRKFGKQLIFEFAVYKADSKTDAPTEPLKHKATEGDEETPVRLSKFVYFMYKKLDEDKNWVEGEYQTAITPNSAMTKLLKILGWTFSTEDVDPEEFIGNWVELNVDDYTQGEGNDAYTASTIKDINPYLGPEVDKVEEVKATEAPKSVKKQVKQKVEEPTPVDPNASPEEKEIQVLEEKIEGLKKLNKEGFLSDDGLKQATEQMEVQIKELSKK